MYKKKNSRTSRRAIIVDPFSSGSMLAKEILGRGISPIAVLSSLELTKTFSASYRPQEFYDVIIYDGDLASLIKQIEPLDPEFIIPGSEPGVELADMLAEQICPSLANVPDLKMARRDKGAMGIALAAAHIPQARQICTDDPQKVVEWLIKESLDGDGVIVKPPRSAGTDSVRRASGTKAVVDAFLGILNKVNRLGILNNSVLVQEYLCGTEYVVDTFSRKGQHAVVDICQYTKCLVEEGTAAYVRMDFLQWGDAELRPLVEYVFRVLDAVGIQHGPGHSEVMLTAEGPRLIETAARMHGGPHPRYARQATGASQLDYLLAYYAGPKPKRYPETYALKNYTTVKFLRAENEGTVLNAEILDGIYRCRSFFDAQDLPRTGRVVAKSIDLFTTLGIVVLSHSDRDQVERDYETICQLEAALRIH